MPFRKGVKDYSYTPREGLKLYRYYPSYYHGFPWKFCAYQPGTGEHVAGKNGRCVYVITSENSRGTNEQVG